MIGRGFGSDNHSGVHPELMQTLLECNQGHTPSYGTDPWSEAAAEVFRNHFGPSCQTFFVFNGTGANVCALRAMNPGGYRAVLCSQDSHIYNDECGAPERVAGTKLIKLPSPQGKLQLSDLKEALIRRGDQHHVQIQILSLTQPTELGTCYSYDELRELTNWAKTEGLFIHLDGARLPLAARALKRSFAELTTELGIDIVCFGGTKNGLMMGEAVVILNAELSGDFKFLRKQSLQLPSKTRFISAQFSHYLGTDLWQRTADHSLEMASLLYERTKNIPGVEIDFAPQSNAVFARIPQPWVKSLRKQFFFYVWDEKNFLCRWMTSFDTKAEDIEGFAAALKAHSRGL